LVDEFLAGLFQTFTPQKPITPSQWQELHRVMEPGAAKHGRWRNYPFQVEILDAITDPDCSQLTLKFCSQLLGKSAILTGIIGWLIDQNPTSILNVHPTDDGASYFSRNRLSPMIQSIPRLNRLISDTPLRRGSLHIGAGQQRLQFKHFRGGWILMGGSNSPNQLRAHSARVTIFDETSAFQSDVSDEGDPILLAKQRSARFADAFSIAASTPTIAGQCRITTDFEQSDQRFWEIPCIHCKKYFVPKWSMVVWPKDKDAQGHTTKHHIERAVLQCPICNKEITDQQRMKMVWKGRWHITNPGVEGHRGYSGDCLMTLGPVKRGFKSWLHYFASRFFEALALGPPGMKTFQNLLLNETWEPEAEKPPEFESIYNKRELYREDEQGIVLPEKALFLVCGADVQQDRIEAEILGVGRLGETWGVAYKVIRGNTETPSIYNEFDSWIQQPWRHPSGHKLTVACTVMDSGNLPQQIYQYSYRVAPRPVYCGKGVRGFESAWVVRSTGQRQRLFILKVDGPKAQLFSRLNLQEFGPGYQHIPSNDSCGYDGTWCQQLVSEVLRTTMVHGRAVKFFTKTSSGIRNESLDARILAMAAIEILNPDFDAIERSLTTLPLHDWRQPEGQSEKLSKVTAAPPPLKPEGAPVRPVTNPFSRRKGWKNIY
jgi:phage terminase large subunit GpA-like protein